MDAELQHYVWEENVSYWIGALCTLENVLLAVLYILTTCLEGEGE